MESLPVLSLGHVQQCLEMGQLDNVLYHERQISLSQCSCLFLLPIIPFTIAHFSHTDACALIFFQFPVSEKGKRICISAMEGPVISNGNTPSWTLRNPSEWVAHMCEDDIF